MQYLNLNTNEYPRYEGDIKLLNLNWTNDLPLPEGWVVVHSSISPEHNSNQYAIEVFPKLIDGEYYQEWQVIDFTEDEMLQINTPKPEKNSINRGIFIWDFDNKEWKDPSFIAE